MKKKLKNIKIFLSAFLLCFMGEAQKVGNGGSFNTDQARIIINKVMLVLKNNLVEYNNPVNSEWVTAPENTKQVFDLNSKDYVFLNHYIVVTSSTKTNEGNKTICIIGTTESFLSILLQNSTGELVKTVSQQLVTLDSLTESERRKVVLDIKRGVQNKLVGSDCVLD